MSKFFTPQKPNYFYVGFAVATGLLILLFALGPFELSLGIISLILFLAGVAMYYYYRSMNQNDWL